MSFSSATLKQTTALARNSGWGTTVVIFTATSLLHKSVCYISISGDVMSPPHRPLSRQALGELDFNSRSIAEAEIEYAKLRQKS